MLQLQEGTLKMENKYSISDKLEKIDEVTIHMFPQICRICLSGENLRSIHSEQEDDGVKAADILSTYALVQVEEYDELPQNVCVSCLNKLYDIFSFFEECRYAQNKLQRILKKSKNVKKGIYGKYLEHDYCSEDKKDAGKSELDDLATTYKQEDGGLVEKHTKGEGHLDKIPRVIERKETMNTDIETDAVENSIEDVEERTDVAKVIYVNFEDKCDLSLDQLQIETVDDEDDDDDDLNADECEIIKIEYIPDDSSVDESCEEQKCSSETEGGDDQTKGVKTKTKRMLPCEYCNLKFTNVSNLLRHKYVHTAEKPHKCPTCDKSFIRRESLKIHMKYHTGEKHNECEYCGKEFTTISNYNRHITQHKLLNGELKEDEAKEIIKTLTCTYCNKMFSSKHTLRTHMMVHSEKLFSCDVCGKKFTFMGNLRSHYRSHSGERPYQCHYCHKAFAFKNSLKEHIYIHTGERPHTCSVCGKGFAQHQQLKTHLRTHTGERPYTCNFCGKSFANKVNMTVHIRIHTGVTPFVCPMCQKGFHDSSSLKKHMKRHEDVENLPQQLFIADC